MATLLFIDGSSTGAKDALASADGSLLTLTNDVRILWDSDKTDIGDLVVAIDRIKERIIELEN